MSDMRDRDGGRSRDIGDLDPRRGSISPRITAASNRGRERSRSVTRGGGSGHRSSSRSGSRSRKYSSRRGGERSFSKSPRRRYEGSRGGGGGYRGSNNRQPIQDPPGPNKCLGVFGLSLRTTERDLRDVFTRYGPIEECQVIQDAQTGRSRGFSFIYFESIDDAKAAKDSCNGIEIDGRRIRVDFSITQRAHTPTPGIYMGKVGKSSGRRRPYNDNYNGNYDRRRGEGFRRDDHQSRNNYSRGHNYGRSPSPYYSRSQKRVSRSRSFSPSPRSSKYY